MKKMIADEWFPLLIAVIIWTTVAIAGIAEHRRQVREQKTLQELRQPQEIIIIPVWDNSIKPNKLVWRFMPKP